MSAKNLLLAFLLFFACQSEHPQRESDNTIEPSMQWVKKTFGAADLYHLKNDKGVEVEIINFGGIVKSIRTPDRNGNFEDIVLGFDSLEAYQAEHPYFGAIIGRYGNRIANGKFRIDGVEYSIATNNAPNTLHGGTKGFDKYFWKAAGLEKEDAVGVALSRTSPDMEEGYPGKLDVKVTYWLNNDNELLIEYEARTDKSTVVNLTNHSYFNLKGAGNGDILDHEVKIKASKYNPVDSTLIPIGIARVENTPFDFQTMTRIGTCIDADDEQIRFGGGYDHNFILDRAGETLESIAQVYEPETGRTLEVLTTEPAVQFYCGNFLDGTDVGKGGKAYQKNAGFCLETQHYPDSPNQAAFPSTLLKAGEVFSSSTVYKFGVR